MPNVIAVSPAMDLNDRDLSDPELIQAGDTPSGAFIEVAVARGGETGRFRFASSPAGRALVERVLGTRPFDATVAAPYRYFYAGQGGHGTPLKHLLYVRIERGPSERTIEFESPVDLVTALQWFRQLPSLMAAAHLKAPA
jgi:hypothetical protein